MSTLLDSVTGAEVIPETETLPITPQTDEDKILAFAHEKYKTGEWKWIQNSYHNHASGRCLSQAITDAGWNLGFSSPTILDACQAIEGAVGEYIPCWNDDPRRSFEDVLEVLESTIIGVRT